MKASFEKYILNFKKPSGTSRGVMTDRAVWFIRLTDEAGITGVGEVAPLPGLSVDLIDEMDIRLAHVCAAIESDALSTVDLIHWPSIRCGLEMARLDLQNGGQGIFYASPFTASEKSIRINGLIWMGEEADMHQQMQAKIAAGYGCIKMKIGAINWVQESKLLRWLCDNYPDIEIRVDANGAFTPDTAPPVMDELDEMEVHSIEQPIKPGQWEEMALLCRRHVIPLAFDEELIPLMTEEDRNRMLDVVVPDYFILKPSLIGGFAECEKWIQLAKDWKVGWWITSALESNVGLNAIAQWTATLNNPLPQGLGTGGLYTNNIDSKLRLDGAELWYGGAKYSGI